MARVGRVGSGAPPMGGRLAAGRHGHGDGAVAVGAVDLGARGGEDGEGGVSRMAVRVVDASGDQPVDATDAAEERRVGGGRSVVGDGQRRGRQRVVTARRHAPVGVVEQVCLRGELDVAGGQQHPGVGADTVDDAQDQRPVVDLAAAVPERPARRRAEHLDGEVAEHGAGGCDHLPHGDVVGDGRSLEAVDRRGRLRHGWPPHRADVGDVEHVADPADVVEVAVRGDDHVEMDVAVACEPPGGGVVLAGVDQQPGLWAADQERVPLPDVDGGDLQRRRGQQPAGEGPHGQPAAGDDGDRDAQPGGAGAGPGRGPQPGGDDRHHGCGDVGAGGTAPAGDGLGDVEDPGGGRPTDRE